MIWSLGSLLPASRPFGHSRWRPELLAIDLHPAWPKLTRPWQRRLIQTLMLEVMVLGGVLLGLFVLSFGPRFVGLSTFIVYGGSMEPTIQTGSIAVAERVSADTLKLGDVIAYRSGDARMPTLHRIIEIRTTETETAPLLILKGDANELPDPERIPARGEGSKVLYSVPLVGRFADFAQSGMGRLLLVWLPCGVTSFLLLWEIWTPKRR